MMTAEVLILSQDVGVARIIKTNEYGLKGDSWTLSVIDEKPTITKRDKEGTILAEKRIRI